MSQTCVNCEKVIDTEQTKIIYSVCERNIKIYSAFFPDLKFGPLCHPCYQKWRSKTKNHPKMLLKTLFCGICNKEEPSVKFAENFSRVTGPAAPNYEKRVGHTVQIGPICIDCNEKYPPPKPRVRTNIKIKTEKQTTKIEKKKKKTRIEKPMDPDSVDLRKYFPNDEFLKLPTIFRIKTSDKMEMLKKKQTK